MDHAMMKIGIDFDNTIIRYDIIFHRVACEQGLISEDFPKSKGKIRDHLRARGIEDAWTKMQGYVYGKRILEAEVFPGVMDFLKACHQNRISVCVISHKTRYPYLGKKYDLHAAARRWIECKGLMAAAGTGLSPDNVFFELTKEKKISRIADQRCDYFIDDLPEFLALGGFPESIVKVLFDPGQQFPEVNQFVRLKSWEQILEKVLEAANI